MSYILKSQDTVSGTIISKVRESYITKVIDQIFLDLKRLEDPNEIIHNLNYIHTQLFRQPQFQVLSAFSQVLAMKYCMDCGDSGFTIRQLIKYLDISYVSARTFITYLETYGLVIKHIRKNSKEYLYFWFRSYKPSQHNENMES